MPTIIVIVLIFLVPSPSIAKCDKQEICEMANKMNPFAILDKCPMAASVISECKSNATLPVQELPTPQFVESGNGMIADLRNQLLWLRTEVPNQKKSFSDAERFARSFSIGKQKEWRLPTLSELKR